MTYYRVREVPKSQTYWFFGARFAKGGIKK